MVTKIDQNLATAGLELPNSLRLDLFGGDDSMNINVIL